MIFHRGVKGQGLTHLGSQKVKLMSRPCLLMNMLPVHPDLQDGLGLDGAAEADQPLHAVTPAAAARPLQLQAPRKVHHLTRVGKIKENTVNSA